MDGIGLIATLCCAALGGWAGRRFRLPMGALTGALLAVMTLNLVLERAVFPKCLLTPMQIVTGAVIGCRIGRRDLLTLGAMVPAVLIVLVGMAALNLVCGLLLHGLGGLDVPTALFAAAPGGMQDITLISEGFGADPVKVYLVQMFRVLCIVTGFPPLYRRLLRRAAPAPQGGWRAQRLGLAASKPDGSRASNPPTPCWALAPRALLAAVTLAAGAAGGLLLRALGAPGGAMVGAMVAVAALQIASGQADLPRAPLLTAVQIAAGAYIGSQITRDSVGSLPVLLLPTALMVAGSFVFTSLMALALHKLCRFDPMTCMIMATPGGSPEMAMLAEEFGCDTPKVVVAHMIRTTLVVALFPSMIALVQAWIG
jgi:membrane AbrB-like protein